MIFEVVPQEKNKMEMKRKDKNNEMWNFKFTYSPYRGRYGGGAPVERVVRSLTLTTEFPSETRNARERLPPPIV